MVPALDGRVLDATGIKVLFFLYKGSEYQEKFCRKIKKPSSRYSLASSPQKPVASKTRPSSAETVLPYTLPSFSVWIALLRLIFCTIEACTRIFGSSKFQLKQCSSHRERGGAAERRGSHAAATRQRREMSPSVLA